MQEQVLPPGLEEAPQITAALATADPNHWNIVNDPIYPSCLEIFKARHEASMASEVVTSAGGASCQGESFTPTQELPPAIWPLHPPKPPVAWQDIDVRVTEVMDQMQPPMDARDGFHPRDPPSSLQVPHGGVPQAQGPYRGRPG